MPAELPIASGGAPDSTSWHFHLEPSPLTTSVHQVFPPGISASVKEFAGYGTDYSRLHQEFVYWS